MVLQELDSREEQTNFQQDESQYESAVNQGKTVIQIQNEKYVIDPTILPKPFPFVGAQEVFSRPETANAIALTLAQARNMVARPLKQDEVDAMAQSFAKHMQLMSYSFPTSLVAAGLMTYRGRANFGIPFLQMSKKAWFNPDKIGPFRGSTARFAWRTVTFCAWQGWSVALAFVFFGSMARTSTMNNLFSDPRMRDLKDARAKLVEERSRLPERAGPRQNNPIESAGGRMDQQAMRADAMLRRGRKQQQAEDDMSPTGGAFAEEMSESRMLSDQDVQMNERRQEYESYNQERSGRDREDAMRPQDRQVRARQQSNGPPQDSGSAWERVRREAASGQSNRGPAPVKKAEGGDDYTFSTQMEDRQLAHEEAQKDFDARVERERHGGDFNSGKQNDRWW